MAFPVGLLAFFSAAPAWLNYRVHESIESTIERSTLAAPQKTSRLRELAGIDFSRLERGAYPGRYASLRANLESTGIGPRFRRLEWGIRLSALLVGIFLAFFGTTLAMSRRARRSPADLIVMYRWGWLLATSAALAKIFLLIPLLAYGIYELTSLAANRFAPQLILGIVIGGCAALWRSAAVLLRRVPLEFNEPMSRPVSAADAPELWAVLREASSRLETDPPDNVVIGMKQNFYVTELSVRSDLAKVDGRTLFLSLPLMRRLSADEVLAIVGHELGHFIGEDTRITREFYPMRFKANETLRAIARSGWVGWSSVHSLLFFQWSFGAAEQATSRERELKADQVAARLTSPAIAARALVRFQIFNEALNVGITGNGGRRLDHPLVESLRPIIEQNLLPKEDFWTRLFEESTPHPVDSHPKLRVRLDSLGQSLGSAEAKAYAVEEAGSAYSSWLGNGDALFAEQLRKAEQAIGKIRSRTAVAEADVETEEGRQFLAAHFPERRWKLRRLACWLPVVFLALVGAGFAVGAVASVGGIPKACLASAALLFGWLAFGVWRQHRNGEFVLRAGSLDYTGWRRPLRFSNVRTIRGVQTYGTISVTFHLNEKEPPFWRFSLLLFRRKRFTFSLGMIDAKKGDVFKLLHQYITRQVAE